MISDQARTNQELIEEIADLKQKIIELEQENASHRQAEEVLRKNEEYFRAITHNASDILFAVDERGIITYMSPSAERIIGYSPDELTGRSVFDLFTSDDLPRAIDDFNQALLTKDVAIHKSFRVRHKDGSELIMEGVGKNFIHNPAIASFLVNVRDVTDQKRAELFLRESEAKLQAIFNTVGTGILIIDRDTQIIMEANQTAVEMTGLPRERIIGQVCHNVVCPAQAGACPVKDLGQCVDDSERKLRCADGRLKDILKTVYTITIKGRDYYLESFIDITERKHTEQSLRESEEKYRLIAENMTDVIAIMDMNLRFTFISPSIMRLRGFTVEEAMTQPLEKVMTPESLARASGVFEEEMHREAGGTDNPNRVRIMELEQYKKDLSTLWVETSLSFLRDTDGRPIGILSLTRDIAERKRIEETLRESEIKYQSIFENTGTGMLIVEEDMTISFVNAEFEKITGYGRQEIEGKKKWTEFVAASDLERMVQQHKKRRIDLSQAEKSYEFRLVHRNGSLRDLYLMVAIIPGTQKSVASFMDITERKKAEAKRRELEERLQRAEKMEALGTLAGGVAHDLNNVLGVVIGYAELLLMTTDESSPNKPHLMNIMKGSERAAAIVQDLLTLARRGVPGRDVLNLNNIIAECQLSPEFEKLFSYHPAVRIETDLEPDLLNISGSSVHLGKTLFNLVSNASEAMAKGGVVTVRTANQYLEKPIHGYDEVRQGDYVVLTVSDTGEGMPEADLKHIFEPFFTKKVMGRSGTGLGLAVVWGTVKDHNGYINVESKEGKGSTFTLYFPVTREDMAAKAAAISISEYTGRGETILVVDDVTEQRDLAAEMLRKLHYNVTAAASGEEAVAYLRDHVVDLMVLDMIMDPGMDGLDTYRSVLAFHPQQKAIIVSGFSESDRVHAAQALGTGAYVKKPYVMEKLGLAVKHELARSA